MSLLDVLAPLDYPRQSATNFARGLKNVFTGDATYNDLLGMAPGAIGGIASGFGSPLIGALTAGAAQGLGNLTGMDAFKAPTTADTVEAFGGDRESWWQNLGAQLATDPLTYATAAVVPGMPSFSKLLGRASTPAEKMAAIAAATPDELGNELKMVANVLGDVNEEFQYAKDPIRMMATRAGLVDDARRMTSRPNRYDTTPYVGMDALNPREQGVLAASDMLVQNEGHLVKPFDRNKLTYLAKKGRVGDMTPEELRTIHQNIYHEGPTAINPGRHAFNRDQYLPSYFAEPYALQRQTVHPANLDNVLGTMIANNYPTVAKLSPRNPLRLRQTQLFPEYYSNPDSRFTNGFVERKMNEGVFNFDIDAILRDPNEVMAYQKYFYPGGVGDDYLQWLMQNARNPVEGFEFRTPEVYNYLLESLISGKRPAGPFPGLMQPPTAIVP